MSTPPRTDGRSTRTALRNIAANLGGGLSVGLIGLACTPTLIRMLGVEAYGLVSIYVMLASIGGFLDLGLAVTVNRELARLDATTEAQRARDLVRSLEILYWLFAMLFGGGVALLAEPMVYHWLTLDRLSPETVADAVRMMGLALAFQLPATFYAGGLLGLERQVQLNAITVLATCVRWGGVLASLRLASPTIGTFLGWQIGVSVLQTAAVAVALLCALPAAPARPRFRADLVRSVGRFAAGMTGIAALSAGLTQLDKIVLGRTVPLVELGYYALAGSLALCVSAIVQPVFQALYPRFTQLVAGGDADGLRFLYHGGTQLVAVLILPVGAVLSLLAPEVLYVWTRDLTTVEHTAGLLRLLVLGMTLSGLLQLPYALQLAHGWTGLTLGASLVAVALQAPGLVVMTNRFGAVGAAWVWLLLNIASIGIAPAIMHRRLLPGELGRWYVSDLAPPLLAASAAAGVGRFLIRGPSRGLLTLAASIVGVSLAALLAAAMAAPQVRGRLARGLSRW